MRPSRRQSMLRRMKRIVIATDGSAGAREALETGLSLARESRAVATLVYVRSPGSEPAQARAVLGEAAALAEQADVEFETEILEGNPARRVAEIARLHDADLIVVGSRGRGAFAGAFLGSVSVELVHRADRPVLVATEAGRARRQAA